MMGAWCASIVGKIEGRGAILLEPVSSQRPYPTEVTKYSTTLVASFTQKPRNP